MCALSGSLHFSPALKFFFFMHCNRIPSRKKTKGLVTEWPTLFYHLITAISGIMAIGKTLVTKTCATEIEQVVHVDDVHVQNICLNCSKHV